eukprot:TRINITY_DN1800_c0_g1_i17.p1 TRINITY_DN1800_c0_g1~~TRINITY_DN1800_c0_g1_i17.p1  ORF type:complete len:129 (+),score=7.70 TRINITY_DN1800_c0_g1_i17:222-608(+)
MAFSRVENSIKPTKLLSRKRTFFFCKGKITSLTNTYPLDFTTFLKCINEILFGCFSGSFRYHVMSRNSVSTESYLSPTCRKVKRVWLLLIFSLDVSVQYNSFNKPKNCSPFLDNARFAAVTVSKVIVA